MLDVFYFFFLKVWRYIQRFRERVEELGEFWGVRLLSQKKAFAAKPYNLCFIPRTYMAQRENNSESCPLTSLDATACVHVQVTQEDRVVNLSS